MVSSAALYPIATPAGVVQGWLPMAMPVDDSVWRRWAAGAFTNVPGSVAANHTCSFWALLLGVSPPPGAVLVLHSLPLEFPLAMAFAEQLLSWKSEDSDGKSEDEPDAIPTSVLLHVVELLGEQVSGVGGGWVAATCQSTSTESRLGGLDSESVVSRVSPLYCLVAATHEQH